MIGVCDRIGIAWFASAFSPDDVAFLETVGCPRYKISAYEMLDGDLINAVVATDKPLIMSVRPTERVTIMQATDYGGNLAPIGISDHTKGGEYVWESWRSPMVERHIMLRDVPCEDQEFSATPAEFARYVKMIRS
jgi:sialic acid synthase SpsE